MKILLVDDSRAVAAVMGARLSGAGYEVILAENGKVAVEQFRASAPDLVLMDIEMPVMNGFQAAQAIRELEATGEWAWTPIIFLTASDTPENLVTAIEAGGDDFIAKILPEAVLEAKMKAMARIARLRDQLSAANRKLTEQASQDGLTGLCNRRYMDLRLDSQWAGCCDAREPFGLLMLDVDHFKKYNDHYGHQAGDDCLKAVARAISETVEAANVRGDVHGALAARYGGEEFAVLMPRCTRDTFRALADAICTAIRTLAIPHERNAEWGIVTASVGGAYAAQAEGRVALRFREADANLYRAKDLGRNRAVLD
ncbi:MAG TPA: diguanylate cyclase [Zoogloea sp.]|uniref:diguanylate cyclase domain-containing protein n=1 Tax=Zoogloea sp. TaxID=49181 RepID=UPI002B8C31D4|nr:diguanylate cyclase [Zoogloea sp.]HMV62444.1 diguanylate cyclase [Rhodocyclaceae bacterium]HMW52665.1 diguanylate cyclase [Rhodocyclaceae bacterium]HMZ77101.1 diguanylate cyclase [Rhodocyclaceae bacterium]HNB64391.1 diguanylate cyclase [Rhodocyclaceae bacterium]HNC80496.1 diguanylate cyclase [Rhodocyclaceae bacterium]